MALTQPIEDYYPVHPLFVNHDIMPCTAGEVKGDYLFSGRALGITTPYDIIQLHPQLMDEFPAICDHYDRIGLSYTNQIIWNLHFDELKNYAQYEGSFFCFGDAQHHAAGNENWYRVANYIQSQDNFVTLAAQLGMRVANLHLRNDIPDCAGDAVSKSCYTVYPEASTALNLQYQVTGSHLERLAATEQFLEGLSHQGNRFPTPHNAWYCVEPMAKWLFSHGMRGIFAFDVAVMKDACGSEYVPMTCQPRFNGASYPTLIAKKLAIQRWQTRAYATRFHSITALPIRDLEYNPADQSGIVLVNWGTVLVGRLLMLIAGTPVQQQALREELERRL